MSKGKDPNPDPYLWLMDIQEVQNMRIWIGFRIRIPNTDS